jgi:hypothetical protein
MNEYRRIRELVKNRALALIAEATAERFPDTDAVRRIHYVSGVSDLAVEIDSICSNIIENGENGGEVDV